MDRFIIAGLVEPLMRFITSNNRPFDTFACSNTLNHLDEKSAFSNAPPHLIKI